MACADCRQTSDDGVERRVEPDGKAVAVDEGTVLGVDEGAAAGCDDHMSQRQEIQEDGAFHRAKSRFTVAREDGRDGTPFTGFDALVDVFHTPIQPAP